MAVSVRVWRRVGALVLILSALLPAALPGPTSAQQPNACSYFPAGGQTSIDRPDECHVYYYESDGINFSQFSLRRYGEPADAQSDLNPGPWNCADAARTGATPCTPLDQGDPCAALWQPGFSGVSWKNGTCFAWTRGCYLLSGCTWDESATSLTAKVTGIMLQVDKALTATACPGCPDPSKCQPSSYGSGSGAGGTGSGTGTGTGSTAPCGPGSAAGPFAVAGYGCQYEEALDGVTCQAAIVNPCPDADLWYEWSLDGQVAPGFTGDLFNPSGLGLCAGDHVVSVSALDKRNGLQTAPLSWTFKSTLGPPCPTGGAGTPNLSLTAPDCYYFEREERVMCSVQTTGAPPGSTIEYEWKWDGKVQNGNGPNLDVVVRGREKTFTCSVVARDKATGAASAEQSATVKAGYRGQPLSPGVIILQGPGAAILLGSKKGAGMRLKAAEAPVKVAASCQEQSATALLEMGYDASFGTDTTAAAEAYVTVEQLDCAGLVAGGPIQIAAVGDAALVLSQAAQEDLPAQIRIEMLDGPVHVSAVSDQVLIDVQTSEASVRSAGANDFALAFDGQTGATLVRAYSGSVQVYDMGSGVQIASLDTGQQVNVAPGESSEVERIPGSASGRSRGRALVPLLVVLGGALSGVAGVALWRRGRRPRARPAHVPQSSPARIQPRVERTTAEPGIRPAKPAGGWYCGACGQPNRAGSRFCGGCGAARPVLAPAEWTCNRCGQVNRPESRFCVGCGSAGPQT